MSWSVFNEEQQDHMRSLAAIPADQRCWCGWNRVNKCYNCPAGYSLAQRLIVQCPSCRNFPRPWISSTLTHVITCKERPCEP